MNCGQTCIAPDYLLVHKEVKAEFVEKLKATVTQFYGTNPKESADYTRIINENHSRRLQGYLTEDHGGRIIHGDIKEIDLKNKYVPPFVVDNPKLTSKMMQDEIFGPILPIIDIENVDEAIKFINSRHKPLALYYFGPVFSSNKEKIIQQTSSGALVFNESVFQVLNEELPFGGVGNSGMGAVHGKTGFDQMSHLKSVMDKAPINSFPFSSRFPPYTQSKQTLMRTLLKTTNFSQSRGVVSLLSLSIIIFGFYTYKLGLHQTTLQKVLNTVRNLVSKVTKRRGGNL